jgi:hypothetical protein
MTRTSGNVRFVPITDIATHHSILSHANFEVLTSWRVFGNFRQLNPSYPAAIKFREREKCAAATYLARRRAMKFIKARGGPIASI